MDFGSYALDSEEKGNCMDNRIVGIWKPYARQAVFGETPIRPVGENQIATLNIFSDGEGFTKRRALLGKDKVELTWESVFDDGEEYYNILIGDGFLQLLAYIENDEMHALVLAPDTVGLYRSGMFFRRQAS